MFEKINKEIEKVLQMDSPPPEYTLDNYSEKDFQNPEDQAELEKWESWGNNQKERVIKGTKFIMFITETKE